MRSPVPEPAALQRQRLDELETQQGPYAPGLTEPLADLGRSLSRSGDIVGAARAYNRALHVLRVNEGLYSDNQLPFDSRVVFCASQPGRLARAGCAL